MVEIMSGGTCKLPLWTGPSTKGVARRHGRRVSVGDGNFLEQFNCRAAGEGILVNLIDLWYRNEGVLVGRPLLLAISLLFFKALCGVALVIGAVPKTLRSYSEVSGVSPHAMHRATRV